MRQTATYIKEVSLLTLHVPMESSIYIDVTANNFSRRHFQMCFAGPSMGNSADADQMSPNVAFHLGLHCLMKFNCIQS